MALYPQLGAHRSATSPGHRLTLDDERYVLQRNDQALKLEPKVLDLLVYLLRHRDRVVLKNELITELWPDQVVSEAALTHCVAKARKAVQDDGGSQRLIKTLHGRGYRFVAEVVVGQPTSIQEAGGAPTPSPVVVPLTIGHPWEQRRLALIGVLLVLVSFTVGPLVFSSSRSAEAIAALKRTLTRNPDYLLARLRLAMVYSEAGQPQEAKAHFTHWRELSPNGSFDGARQPLPYKERADLERTLAALRNAGLQP